MDGQSHLISIVMATYNGADFLREQLDSIINQSYTNLEIIIQDDGSTDDTVAVLREYESRDKRITLYQNPANLGINKNFYDLINKASGDYIAISDQDDIWHIQKIEILLKNIGPHSLIYTDSLLIDEIGKNTGSTLLKHLQLKPKSGKMLTNLLTHNTISGHACLFSNSIKAKFAEVVRTSKLMPCIYDQLIGSIASFQNGVAFVDQPLTSHRIHANNNCNHLQQGVVKDAEQRAGREHLHRDTNKKKRRKTNFFERKQKRVSLKINRAWQSIVFIRSLFALFFEDELNPFIRISYSRKDFKCRFFYRKLYIHLKQIGLEEHKAKALSRGRYYYLLLCYF